MDSNQQVLRIAYRAHHAADGDGKSQRNQQDFRLFTGLASQREHDRRADDCQRIVKEKRRDNAHPEENKKHQRVKRACPRESTVSEVA